MSIRQLFRVNVLVALVFVIASTAVAGASTPRGGTAPASSADQHAAASPTLRGTLYSISRAGLWAAPLDGSRPVRLILGLRGYPIQRLDVSPNRRKLLLVVPCPFRFHGRLLCPNPNFSNDDALLTVDRDGRNLRFIGRDEQAHSATWGRDSRHIFAFYQVGKDSEGVQSLVRLDTRNPAGVVTLATFHLGRDSEPREFSVPTIRPDGRQFAFTFTYFSGRRDLWTMDARGRNPRRILAGSANGGSIFERLIWVDNRTLAFDNDFGQKAACGDAFGNYITVGRIGADGRRRKILDWYYGTLVGVVPDGRLLIWGGDERDCVTTREQIGFGSLDGEARFAPLKPQPKRGGRPELVVIDRG